jgi:3-oxoacyl-[acyl-carrier-protein] synthase II
MKEDVVISGFGVFSGFGFGEKALFDGTFSGVPAFRAVTRFDASGYRSDQAATYEEASAGSPFPASEPDTFDVLVRCCKGALDMAGGPKPETLPLITALKLRAPSVEAETPGHLTGRVADRLGLGTPRRTFVNACCAGTNAIIHAAQLIRAGVATCALAGGAFLVDRQAFALFDAAFALASDGRLRPFDRDRQGVLLGDGGAMLVLESAGSAYARGTRPLARLAGWAMTDDAFHVAQPQPEGSGVASAIREALRRAQIDPGRLAYVNAHGTGTVLNDAAEAAGLRTALGPATDHVLVSSTKSTTGHALEACGALETVITLLAMTSSVIPPTAGLTRPDPRCVLRHVACEPERAAVPYAMSLNSSVGGLNTALVLGAA